ncbi:MAG: hypothetical protein MK165_12770 [Pirellulaceae bacterium]|nr:hypothetical protein [Pirellulaceae bacterium]
MVVPCGLAKESHALRFEEQIKSIFLRHCVRCHGGQTQEADLDLSNMPALLRGSADGDVLVAGQPDASPLFSLITAGEMPADRETEVTVAEVE